MAQKKRQQTEQPIKKGNEKTVFSEEQLDIYESGSIDSFDDALRVLESDKKISAQKLY